MRVVMVALSVVVGVVASIGAQALPSNYKLQFENAWVRVTEVRYAPMEKVTAHSHTPYPSAYVYLNDGPPVVFRHVGGKGMAATRAATKAGAFRVYKGIEEIHEVENTGNAASEFLRVELKTAPLEPGSFFGRYERSAPAIEPTVHFDHSQVRISRVWVNPGQTTELTTSEDPALVIALGSGVGLKVGESKWIETSSAARVSNTSRAPVDLLRLDFKTRPIETRQ